MTHRGHHAHPRQLATGTTRCLETGPEFVPVLLRQRDHGIANNQPDRAHLDTHLLAALGGGVVVIRPSDTVLAARYPDLDESEPGSHPYILL